MERNFCVEEPLTCAINLTEIFGISGWFDFAYLLTNAAPYVLAVS